MKESRNVRPGHAHFAVNVKNDVVGDESGGAAVVLHLVEEVDGVPVAATTGVGAYHASVGVDVNLEAVVLEREKQGGGGGDAASFGEDFDDEGDCRSGGMRGVGGSKAVEDGEGEVALVVEP